MLAPLATKRSNLPFQVKCCTCSQVCSLSCPKWQAQALTWKGGSFALYFLLLFTHVDCICAKNQTESNSWEERIKQAQFVLQPRKNISSLKFYTCLLSCATQINQHNWCKAKIPLWAQAWSIQLLYSFFATGPPILYWSRSQNLQSFPLTAWFLCSQLHLSVFALKLLAAKTVASSSPKESVECFPWISYNMKLFHIKGVSENENEGLLLLLITVLTSIWPSLLWNPSPVTGFACPVYCCLCCNWMLWMNQRV